MSIVHLCQEALSERVDHVLIDEPPPHHLLHSIDPDNNFFNSIFGSFGQSRQSAYYTVDQYNSCFDSLHNYLTILNFNIRSFGANGDSFLGLLHSLNNLPQIIILTETWLDDENKKYCNIDGYSCFHSVRNRSRGGGVSVFCSGSAVVDSVDRLSVCSNSIETCVVRLKFDINEIFIVAIYRPHADTIDNFVEQLNTLLQDDILVGKNVIIAGDLNINLLIQNDISVDNFIASLQSQHFLPVITKATRFPPGNQQGCPSLLDHIWYSGFAAHSAGIILTDITDHCPTFLHMAGPTVNNNDKVKITFRSHDPKSVNTFMTRLGQITWNFSLYDDVHEQTSHFIHSLNNLYKNCFPQKNQIYKC